MPYPLIPTVWLSLATGPFLWGMLAVRFLTEGLIELGESSEEVLRGDRLPLLNLPEGDNNN